MNGILGMAQLLLSPDLKDREKEDFARIILNSGQTLLTLLNDILDLSKVEAGKLKLERIAFDPQQLLREVVALFSEGAEHKGLRIEVRWVGLSDGRYEADPLRIRQMLGNLISNAIKFTEKGWVRVEGREVSRNETGALLEFAVIDSGIGIPEDRQNRLFQPFSQVDSSTTRQYGGTGLGLSIIRSLALAMGGAVGVDSQPGKGSRFWFRIQAGLILSGCDTRRVPRSSEPVAAPALSASLVGHILVVEDNATNRYVITAMLKKLGLTVRMAENGQQAVDILVAGERPDLVLMDIQMPVMDGFGATKIIRQFEAEQNWARLPIIALTADAFDDDRQHCMDADMDDFLPKPVALDALQAVLARRLPSRTTATLADVLPVAGERLVDDRQLCALIDEIDRLLVENKFDAIGRFQDLQGLLQGHPVADELKEIGRVLNEFRYEAALAGLRNVATANGWRSV